MADLHMPPAAGQPRFEIAPRKLSPRSQWLLRSVYLLGAIYFIAGVVAGQYILAAPVLLLALLPMALRQERRLRVLAYDDRLVVTNRRSQRTFLRSEIVGFSVETPTLGKVLKANQAVAPAINVQMRDGSSTPLEVTIRKFPDGSLPESLNRLEQWLRPS